MFDLPTQVELRGLIAHYIESQDRHTLKFAVSRDLWLRFECPEPGKILRGLWWRKGDTVVEEIELQNYTPGFSPGYDLKRPDANANTYTVRFDVTEEVWNQYKPWKRADFAGVLWGASDDEFDARIVEKWREKMIAIAAETPAAPKEEKKRKKEKEPSPYGKFWNEFDRAMQGGLANNPMFKGLILRESKVPLTGAISADQVRNVIRDGLGVKSRKFVAPDVFNEWLRTRGLTDENFLLEVSRMASRTVSQGQV